MYDYIIVGGGSGGGVMANRLSESGTDTVFLLEAGSKANSPFISTPAMFSALVQDLKCNIYNWRFNTKPDASMNGRSQYQPRGKGLGGSSNINAMVYTRGDAADYDAWEAEGNPGWGYKDVLPYFKKAENNERGENEFHGVGGPLNVTDGGVDFEMYNNFLRSSLELGYRYNPDFNGENQEGVGVFQFTVKDGKRAGVRASYIAPAMSRPNLLIETGAQASRILFEGKRAVGVEYIVNGKTKIVRARKEVILSSGAFGSPQLLLLSGVGPAQELQEKGIDVVHDLPGVGKNLQEHPDVMLVFKSKTKSGISMTPLGMIKAVGAYIRYLITGKGWIANPPTSMGGFLKSDDDQPLPNFQIHFVPLAYRDHARDWKLMASWGFSYLVNLSRPKSRGEVTLASKDPMAQPDIQLNLLQHPDDMKQMRDAVKRVMEIANHSAMDDIRGDSVQPPKPFTSDEDVEGFLRREGAHVYHPVGTCKMGSDDMAVVDQSLKVHGLEGIRVVDASIMPLLIGANTNAPTIMIAEKVADMMKQEKLAQSS